MRWIDLSIRLVSFPTGLLDFGEDAAHRSSQILLRFDAANMHEHYSWRVPHEVIVKSGHFEAVIERRAHHRTDLILQKHQVPHHYVVFAITLECSPGGETHGWSHFHSGYHDRQILAWDRNFKHTL